MLLWGELYVDMLLTKGDKMPRYEGPTLLTYEEWWEWESKRLKAGKAPSQRKVKRWCTTCKHDVEEKYCPHTYESMTDKVTIVYERKD